MTGTHMSGISKYMSRNAICTKFLKAISDYEEELLLIQSSLSDSLEARPWQLDFVCG